MNKSVVLLSGGLDSAVNLAEAERLTTVVAAITFDYGQESAAREVGAAGAMCDRYDLNHFVIELPWLSNSASSLTGESAIPDPEPGELDDDGASLRRADAVWVPNRNGIFLNIAAGMAEQAGAEFIVPGFNAEEAAAFPDNSREFIEAENAALGYSTRGRVAVECYTADLRKTAVAELGLENGTPLDLVWSCYRGASLMCGRCESCLRLIRALKEAGSIELLRGRIENIDQNKTFR